jgi:hypothetical protein
VEALASLYVRVAVSLLNIPFSLRPSYEMRGTRIVTPQTAVAPYLSNLCVAERGHL